MMDFILSLFFLIVLVWAVVGMAWCALKIFWLFLQIPLSIIYAIGYYIWLAGVIIYHIIRLPFVLIKKVYLKFKKPTVETANVLQSYEA